MIQKFQVRVLRKAQGYGSNTSKGSQKSFLSRNHCAIDETQDQIVYLFLVGFDHINIHTAFYM